MERRLVVAWAKGGKEWGVTAHGHGVSSGDDENILKLDDGNDCTML